jgi:glycosyltransferase involved in cell wall biosynthesis
MTAEKPKISVIVANYNHAQFVEQSVRSVLNQTYQNYEVIVVDDGSSDNSREVIEELAKLDDRIVEPLFIEKNAGKWNALNRAIEERATGVLITAQDADDTTLPQRLERQLEVLQKTKTFHNLCGFHHCHTQEDVDRNTKLHISDTIGEDKILTPDKVIPVVFEGFKHPQIKQFWTGNFECHGATALFYRQLWDHGMRFNPPKKGLRITWSEDSDFNIRLALLLQKTSVLLEKLYCYRRDTSTHGTGDSTLDTCF